MKKLEQKVLRYIIFIFAMIYFNFSYFLENELNIDRKFNRMPNFKEALPTASLYLVIALLMTLYAHKLCILESKVIYLMILCFIIIFFLIYGYFEYKVTYKALGSWYFHMIICILFFICNFVYIFLETFFTKQQIKD